MNDGCTVLVRMHGNTLYEICVYDALFGIHNSLYPNKSSISLYNNYTTMYSDMHNTLKYIS